MVGWFLDRSVPLRGARSRKGRNRRTQRRFPAAGPLSVRARIDPGSGVLRRPCGILPAMPTNSRSRGGRWTPPQDSDAARRFKELPAEELLRRCLEHAPNAWDELIRRYANLIYSTIVKVGIDESDQEDAFQETVLTIYRSLGKLRQPEKLVPWIIGIAYRQAVNRIRARSRSRETSIQDLPEGEIVGLLDESSPLEGDLSQLEQSQRLQEALEAIPDRCRRLLEILFYEDPPPDYTEIARREAIPVGSIGPTRSRCLAKLRRIYQERRWEP
jgi:RNA polymerase sigma factor (sigma-70 family)